MPVDPEAFARKLVELGERHVLDQNERADRIGISRRQYKRWETGTVAPRMANIRAVAEAYGMEPPLFLAELADDTGSLQDRLERIEAALTLLLEHHGLLGPPQGELAELLRAVADNGKRRRAA